MTTKTEGANLGAMRSIRTKLEADLAEVQGVVDTLTAEAQTAVERKQYIEGLIKELGDAPEPRGRSNTIPDLKERILGVLDTTCPASVVQIVDSLLSDGLDVNRQRIATALGRMVRDGTVLRPNRGQYTAALSQGAANEL